MKDYERLYAELEQRIAALRAMDEKVGGNAARQAGECLRVGLLSARLGGSHALASSKADRHSTHIPIPPRPFARSAPPSAPRTSRRCS